MGEGLLARLKRGWAEANELNRQKDRAKAVERSRRFLLEHRTQENHELLEEAMRRHPEDAEIRLLYASNLLAIRPEDAAAEAIKAVELDPGEPIRLVRAASLLVGMKHFDSAREYAKRARKLAKSDFPLMAGLINLEAHLAAVDGREEEAESGFRRAVALDPETEVLALDLAQYLSRHDRQAEALEVIDQSLTTARHTERLRRLRSVLASPE
jgi:Flp pilus assembly protein TadD